LALGQGLVDEAELLLLEVPQTAVDELGRAGRRAGGEVAPLHQGRPQAPTGGVERHAGAGDAAPDDEQVEGLRGQALEVLPPLAGVEVHRGRAGVTTAVVPGRSARRNPRRGREANELRHSGIAKGAIGNRHLMSFL